MCKRTPPVHKRIFFGHVTWTAMFSPCYLLGQIVSCRLEGNSRSAWLGTGCSGRGRHQIRRESVQLEQIVEHPSPRLYMSWAVIFDKKSSFRCEQLLPDHFAAALTVSGTLPSVWKSDSGDTKPICSAGDIRIFSLDNFDIVLIDITMISL